jgi:hypothetical protein
MKVFFKTVFRISLFEVMLILVFSLLKYFVEKNGWTDYIVQPFIFLGLAMGALFVITVGINGIIENKQEITEPEATREKYKAIEEKYARILNAGIFFPSLTLLVLFAYMIIPTSTAMFIPFVAGILIRNIFYYFSSRNRKPEIQPEE